MVKHENNKLTDDFGPGRVIWTIFIFLLLTVCLVGTAIDIYVAFLRSIVQKLWGSSKSGENGKPEIEQ
jgi:hypothetical protein